MRILHPFSDEIGDGRCWCRFVEEEHAEQAPGLPRRPRWAKAAACRGRTDLFFPAHAESHQARDARESRCERLCRKCPVLDQCTRYRNRLKAEDGTLNPRVAMSGYWSGLSLDAENSARIKGEPSPEELRVKRNAEKRARTQRFLATRDEVEADLREQLGMTA